MELQCGCAIDEIGGVLLVECKGHKEGKFRDWIYDFTIMNRSVSGIFWIILRYHRSYCASTIFLRNSKVLIKWREDIGLELF